MPHPGRNNIYEAAIKRMVAQAMEEQEQQFASDHGLDSDDQLLTYLRSCASILKHTPWPREVVGGCLIEQRFGSWAAALRKAKLPRPNTSDKVAGFARYQEEIERQKVLYREKKAGKKQKAQQRLKAQKEKQNA